MELTLKITVTRDGQIGVEGPLENKLLCMGILEMAKDAIKAYDPKKIQLVRPVSVV